MHEHIDASTVADPVGFLKETTGTTQIEYALIASLVSLAIFAATQQLGSSLNSAYNSLDNTVRTVTGGP